MAKKLVRSKSNKMIAGLAGGLGEFMGFDPTIIRLCLVFLFFLTGCFPIGIAYLISWVIVPVDSQ
jgi:phage shock protein C